MIDTVACCIIGVITGFFGYQHLKDPEGVVEDLLGVPVEDPAQAHFIAVIGAFSIFVSMVMFSLGLFQPSSNARKFALGGFAILEILNISTHYRFPVQGEDHPPSSPLEMPLPVLFALMGTALLGAGLSNTDARRREIVNAKKKAKSKAALYAKHAASKANNKGE